MVRICLLPCSILKSVLNMQAELMQRHAEHPARVAVAKHTTGCAISALCAACRARYPLRPVSLANALWPTSDAPQVSGGHGGQPAGRGAAHARYQVAA